jgi:hypothetical protein
MITEEVDGDSGMSGKGRSAAGRDEKRNGRGNGGDDSAGSGGRRRRKGLNNTATWSLAPLYKGFRLEVITSLCLTLIKLIT